MAGAPKQLPNFPQFPPPRLERFPCLSRSLNLPASAMDPQAEIAQLKAALAQAAEEKRQLIETNRLVVKALIREKEEHAHEKLQHAEELAHQLAVATAQGCLCVFSLCISLSYARPRFGQHTHPIYPHSNSILQFLVCLSLRCVLVLTLATSAVEARR